MYEQDDAPDTAIIEVDITEWVEKAQTSKSLYIERQATDIILNAIGSSPQYGKKIYLKGGILMAVVYHSPRHTADLDFTTSLEPAADIAETLGKELDGLLRRTSALLGYADMLCRVQSIQHEPRRIGFENQSWPALKVKFAYARRGSPQEAKLHAGKCSDVIKADISFNEPVAAIQIVRLKDTGNQLRVYALTDLIAEKLRALLQQESRNRYRRQDIYDIALLLKAFALDEEEKRALLAIFLKKCESRGIVPVPDSLSNPEVVRRARSEWHTIGAEIDAAPDFDDCFAIVDALYRSLPW
jgi:predicted nucleotidyltransferase component of viral defense system